MGGPCSLTGCLSLTRCIYHTQTKKCAAGCSLLLIGQCLLLGWLTSSLSPDSSVAAHTPTPDVLTCKNLCTEGPSYHVVILLCHSSFCSVMKSCFAATAAADSTRGCSHILFQHSISISPFYPFLFPRPQTVKVTATSFWTFSVLSTHCYEKLLRQQ